MSDLRRTLNEAYESARAQADCLIRENALEPYDDQADILYDDVFSSLIDDFPAIEAATLADIASEAITDAHNNL